MTSRIERLAGWLTRPFRRMGTDYAAWQEAQSAFDCDDLALARDIGPRWPEAPVRLPAGPVRR
jgi:hypothetical protein